MADRLRFVSAAALVAALVGSPITASLSSADEIGYVPPSRLKQGVATTPFAGAGTITLKIYVLANGKPKSVTINKSTNHGDDAGAKEVAMSATYKPALRGGKPVAAYYTYILKVTGAGATSDDAAVAAGGVAAIQALNRSGKFADAQKMGAEYVAAHPNDTEAALQTALAASFNNDSAAAADYFDKAGNVPERYKGAAAKSYLDEASAKLAAKDYTAAQGYAKKGAALSPGPGSYNILGNADLAAGDTPGAIADFEKAKAALGSDPKATQTAVATINANLAAAYLKNGDVDKAQAAAAAAKAADPTKNLDGAFANYYNDKAIAASKAGNTAEAVANFEQAAKVDPKDAALLYLSAANVYGAGAKPDYKGMKAEADKAIAVDPTNAKANYIAGVALANDGHAKDAIPYLQKAADSAKSGTDTNLQTQIANALKSVGAPEKK
jgi:tetratricopeptide (TPR) repeat protein